jgi:ankyrin repeat protein
MEAIGFIASLVTLGQVTQKIVSVVSCVRHSTRELQHFKNQVRDIEIQIQLLQFFRGDPRLAQERLSPTGQANVLVQITQAEQHLKDILRDVQLPTSDSKWKVNSKWALKLHAKAERALESIGRVQSTLNCTLTVFIYQDVSKLASQPIFTDVRPNILHSSSVSEVIQAPQSSASQGLLGSSSTESHNLPCARTLETARRKRQIHYSIALCGNLPFSRRIVIDLFLRWCAQNWFDFCFLPGSRLSVVNLVPEDCELMQACREGDFLSVRQLLDRGLARPGDTTPNNRTPMYYAIEKGSLDTVQTLIVAGADVNTVFGQQQTSPLGWAIQHKRLDITRLLLREGASLDHIGRYGWTPLFYIWAEADDDEEPKSTIFIDMLSDLRTFGLQHQNIADRNGFGVIHLSVIWGTVADVKKLLTLGVSPFTTVGPLEWTAIHEAVYYNKPDIFELLLPRYNQKGIPVDEPDFRGWTLLHISAAEGHSRLTRRLLELGANPRSISKANYSHMPEELYGRLVTPVQVAEACEYDRWLDILNAIREVKGEISLEPEEISALKTANEEDGDGDGVEDEWFEALEGL